MAHQHRTCRRVASLAAAAALALALAACATDSARECERTFTELTMSVDGVADAQFECRRSFGDPSQRGTVTLDQMPRYDAVAVMEDVLRTYAASPDLRDATVPVLSFATQDGTITIGPVMLGFNGAPAIGEIREHYGIEP
ncbi:hypothetical protein [Cellulosimicrobium sp. Marseille-Q4280]|uniref:hypothetical protein n=1 Tax=Cellulosimicrobium sp. Marseille-Q4280 TaxID=2937992 RepID=UPI00203B8F9E|nr:hypothetical protein [Cellulosimicrobium sp. Marseille-Q4280]